MHILKVIKKSKGEQNKVKWAVLYHLVICGKIVLKELQNYTANFTQISLIKAITLPDYL